MQTEAEVSVVFAVPQSNMLLPAHRWCEFTAFQTTLPDTADTAAVLAQAEYAVSNCLPLRRMHGRVCLKSLNGVSAGRSTQHWTLQSLFSYASSSTLYPRQ